MRFAFGNIFSPLIKMVIRTELVFFRHKVLCRIAKLQILA